jgi:chromosomal replication initiation ATPase DnaA
MTIRRILKKTSDILKISINKLKGSDKTREITDARKFASAILKEEGYNSIVTGHSLNKTQSSISRCLKEHNNLLKFDEQYSDNFNKFYNKFYNL